MQIMEALLDKGLNRSVPLPDVMIASIAAVERLTVVHDDPTSSASQSRTDDRLSSGCGWSARDVPTTEANGGPQVRRLPRCRSICGER